MRNLFTHRAFIGILMVGVLMLGVLGSAEALTFGTSRTGDLQTALPNQPNGFKIRFSVSLDNNTTRITDPTGKLIKDGTTTGGPADHRIDSAGYLVMEIGGTEYRMIDTNPTGTLVVDPRPTYSDERPITPQSPYYVDTSKRVVDSTGAAVYVRTGGAGNRANPTADPPVADNPWTYTRATAEPTAKVSNVNRYHYNEEAIDISVSGNSSAYITKVGRYEFSNMRTTHNLLETGTDNAKNKLSSSIEVTFNATAAGEVTIMISDITPSDDAPTGGIAAPIMFTVYVVDRQGRVIGDDVEFASTNDGVEYGNEDEDPRLDSYFTFAAAGTQDNAPVNYTVEGSGRVYISKGGTRRTSSTNSLWTSSAAPVYLDMNRSTNKVTVWISGNDPKTLIYIFTGRALNQQPGIEITSPNPQTGAIGGRLESHLEVKVTDGNRRAISGVAVQFVTETAEASFIPVPGTNVYTTGSDTTFALAGAVSEPLNDSTFTATPTIPAKKESPVFVQTDRSGVAKVYYELGGNNVQTITASLVGDPRNVSRDLTARVGTTGSDRVANLEILSGNPQRAEKGKDLTDPLVVIARSTAGYRIPNVVIQFRTGIGILSRYGLTTGPTLATNNNELMWGQIPPGTPNPDSGQQIYVITDSNGEASVNYNVGQFVIAREVIAEIRHEPLDSDYSFAIHGVTFNINGSGARAPTPPTPPAAATNTIGITLSRTTGEPGDEVTVNVSSDPSVRFVTLSSADFSNALFSPQSGTTPFASTLTLPDTDGRYSISATGPAGLTPGSATVTVETGILGRLSITAIGQPSNGAQNFSITVRDTDGDRISGALIVRVSGTGFTSRNIETLNGVGDARLTLPTRAGRYTLTVSANNYTSGDTTISVAGTGQPTTSTPTTPTTPVPAPTVPEPSTITIGRAPATRTGTINEALEAPLLVQVLDDDGNGVADTYVTFRVRTGQGRLSQLGNGRATTVETDARGFARASYTPMSASSTVEAEVRGVARTATFTITTGSAPPATTPTTTPTPGDPTPSTTISPVVQVNAANRPPMLWVDNGAIYALVGANVQRFAPGIDTAINIAIGGNKVYWTEQTGESAGTINSANLNGSGVKELTAIMAVPYGIAVDTDNSKLYWTNSRGRIQSANLDGSGIRNVLENLPDLIDIAIDRGVLYWTQYNETTGTGNVGILNPTGQRNARYVSTGADMPRSIVIGSGKVYWTEQTGTSSGTINAANLNGNSATQLASILAAPSGIAVDASRSKLYWTNSRGRIQSANLDGSGIQNIVDGLGSPADMVISNSITAPTTTSTPTTAANKYDVNGDGTVDVRDSDAVIVAVAAGVTDAKYDVNGDGKVDINDVVAVTANRNGAAGAPTLHGLKFSALEIDRLQEQINLLVATDDRSPAAMRTLIYLQQLIVMARPEKTQLLANYPNPFNPETWIPYELATDTEVRITIYTSTGVVIRTLQFGYQSAGYYTDRERAAYWDGRNAFGEQVASGIYFYQLETDEMSSMRKMVILK